ncbi:hypothetical protein ACFY0G_17285 [Streptomyces sp. NPDC001552]|uniref:hypothetical protein n=1 Tax=Streptomyces sp. NPDC001552 TaxID=3364587 RepID=UPI0036B11F9B
MKTNLSPGHDPKKCNLCGPLQHPAHAKTRRGLAAGLHTPRTPLDNVIGRKNGGSN